MFRIDTSRRVADRPASAAPGSPGYFTNGDPTTGYLPTQLDGEWFNGVQENLMQVLAAGGIAALKGPSGDSNLLDAIRAIIDQKTRTVLTNHLNLYVATTGNDANPGTAGAPFRHIQHAIDYIYKELDLNGFGVWINLAAGTYTEALSLTGRPVGSPAWWATPINIVGNPADPASVHITMSDVNYNIVFVGAGGGLHLSGVKLSHSAAIGTSPANLIYAALSGWIYVSDVEFGASPSAHILCHQARVESLGTDWTRTSVSPYKISGGAVYHAHCHDGGLVYLHGTTVTFVGTPNFTSDLVYSSAAGRIDAANMTFVGSFTGRRFYSGPGGFIQTNGAGVNYFPGSIAGVIDPLGFYY